MSAIELMAPSQRRGLAVLLAAYVLFAGSLVMLLVAAA